MQYLTIDSPVGEILIAGDDSAVRRIAFIEGKRRIAPAPDWTDDANPHIERAARQLDEYFAGRRKAFDFPFKLNGRAFQCAVWNELANIPYGTTISYGELARRIGRPGSSRAVGAANGANPIAIVVPCHRVIGANGKLTGYGGGLPNKEILLELEAANAVASPDFFAASAAV